VKIAKRLSQVKPSATMAISEKAKSIPGVLSFALGEPDFSTPENICAAAQAAIDGGEHHYTPPAGTPALREAIAARLKADLGLDYTPDQICASNGAKHTLINAFMAIVDPGDEVVILAPYWVSYADQVKLAGGTPVVVPTTVENDFQPDPEAVARKMTRRTVAVLINSPSNPTGAIIADETIRALATLVVERDLWLVSDEIYDKIVFDGNRSLSPATLGAEAQAHTILVNGCSKTYAMTGWRMGWAAAPQRVIKAMGNYQSQTTSNASSISQAAALEALTGPQDAVEQMRQEFERRRDYLIPRLRQIPDLEVSNPGGAFYAFPKVSAYFGRELRGRKIKDCLDLCDYLLEEGKVGFVPGEAFGAPEYLRISFACSLDQLEEGMDRLERALRQ